MPNTPIVEATSWVSYALVCVGSREDPLKTPAKATRDNQQHAQQANMKVQVQQHQCTARASRLFGDQTQPLVDRIKQCGQTTLQTMN